MIGMLDEGNGVRILFKLVRGDLMNMKMYLFNTNLKKRKAGESFNGGPPLL